MIFQSSLIPFETLIEYLSFHGFSDNLDTIMQIRGFSLSSTPQQQTSLYLSDECHEKFMNTWWEVCWPFPKASPSHPPKCLYLADSLRDALRLRPNIDIAFLPDKSKSFAEYLHRDKNWFECDED